MGKVQKNVIGCIFLKVYDVCVGIGLIMYQCLCSSMKGLIWDMYEYLQSTLIERVFLIAPLTDIRRRKLRGQIAQVALMRD